MAQDDPDGPAPDHAGRRAAFRERYREEVAFIDADPDPLRAYDAATDFGDLLGELVKEHGGHRGRQAVRVRSARRLSFAQLAAVLRVSKGRSDQLVQQATAASAPADDDTQREDADV